MLIIIYLRGSYTEQTKIYSSTLKEYSSKNSTKYILLVWRKIICFHLFESFLNGRGI